MPNLPIDEAIKLFISDFREGLFLVSQVFPRFGVERFRASNSEARRRIVREHLPDPEPEHHIEAVPHGVTDWSTIFMLLRAGWDPGILKLCSLSFSPLGLADLEAFLAKHCQKHQPIFDHHVSQKPSEFLLRNQRVDAFIAQQSMQSARKLFLLHRQKRTVLQVSNGRIPLSNDCFARGCSQCRTALDM